MRRRRYTQECGEEVSSETTVSVEQRPVLMKNLGSFGERALMKHEERSEWWIAPQKGMDKEVGAVEQIFDGKPDWGSISERQWMVGTCDPESQNGRMQNNP